MNSSINQFIDIHLQHTVFLFETQETRLKAERDDKVRLRGQAGIHKRNGEAGAGEWEIMPITY